MTLSIYSKATAAQRSGGRLTPQPKTQQQATTARPTASQAVKDVSLAQPSPKPQPRPRRALSDPEAQQIMASGFAWGEFVPLAQELAQTPGITLRQAEGIMRAAGATDRDAIGVAGA